MWFGGICTTRPAAASVKARTGCAPLLGSKPGNRPARPVMSGRFGIGEDFIGERTVGAGQLGLTVVIKDGLSRGHGLLGTDAIGDDRVEGAIPESGAYFFEHVARVTGPVIVHGR